MTTRIATSTFYDVSYRAISRNQVELSRLQNQFSSGKRINSAADDPVGMTRAAELGTAKSTNDQYSRNQIYAQNSLGMLDGVLGSIDDVMQSMRETLVAAGNGTLGTTDRAQLGQQLRSKLDELLRLSNSQDESGRYLFSGFNDGTTPFTFGGGTLTYLGDSGVREIPVSSTTNVPLNVSGNELFVSVPSGNGVIQTGNAATNTGTGLISSGNVVNASAITNENFEVRISNVAGSLFYDVVNTSTSTTLISAAPYTPGASITVGPALAVSISGTPAHGDVFTVRPAQNQNVFQSIDSVIDAIDQFASGSISNTALTSALRTASNNLDQSYERVLSVRNKMGNVMQELDRQMSLTSGKDIELQSRLSSIVDLDPAQGAMELTKTQATLEASQTLFARISKRNLFDFL